jgi:SAM-dependent methyltransferase
MNSETNTSMSDTVRTDLNAYYAHSAAEYEQGYAKPAHQQDLAELHRRVRELAQGQRVLEIACGTGYWTAPLAETAAFVRATDSSAEMLALAAAKGLPADKVELARQDAWQLPPQPGFTLCFAGFLWSHIRREEQEAFMRNLRSALGKDVMLVLIDDAWVEGDSLPVARTDAAGNTYQIRTLPNGARYEIPKNFPTDSALRKRLATALKDIRIVRLPHFWMLTGKLR